LAVVVVACSSAPATEGANATTTATSSVPPTSDRPIPTTTFARGDLTDWESTEVLIGDLSLIVALADEETERQQGLTGVSDLGDFDGMLFSWEEETTTGFWMKDTPIALDLFFFNGEGELIDQTSLEPCSAEPCPVFVADGLFRWVLEAPAGSIESVGRLSLSEAG
jgi:uncharacterized membrane protein (UPF0127 family)